MSCPYFIYNLAPVWRAAGSADHFRTDGALQRSHRHQGDGNQHLPDRGAGAGDLRGVLAASLFFFDQFYLPHANKRQDALRNQIKGKPAQTYLRPDRKWIFGQHSDIYYYQFFDADRDQFANISVFQFDPHSFAITQRVYAERAHWSEVTQRWIYEQGWVRHLSGDSPSRTITSSMSPHFRSSASRPATSRKK